MNSKYTQKRRKLLRSIYGTLSLSTALFAFQACYGVERDMGNDALIYGKVTSSLDGSPIKGIKVISLHDYNYAFTGDDGGYAIFTPSYSQMGLRFQDTDSIENGLFQTRDTLFSMIPNQDLRMNISLDVK
jgi:hypothetical protein